MDSDEEMEVRNAGGLALLLILEIERRREKRKRKEWARRWIRRRSEENQGVLYMLFDELRPQDPKSYRKYLRMNEEEFEELLGMVSPIITKMDTVMRQAIPARLRLAVTIHFLAAGINYTELSFSTRIAINTLSLLIPETVEAIITALEKKVIACPNSPGEWEVVAHQFNTQWQFPHCIGALDGKHIAFRPSRKEGSRFRNYKGTDSIVLLALVDANYKFLFVDIGRNGRLNDGSVFSESPLSETLYSGGLNLPLPCPLPGGDTDVPFVIVADNAFSLKENVMKPYPSRTSTTRTISHDKRIFNYRLCRARRVVENAFGILSNRWRILLNTIPLSDKKVESITYACVLLHNFVLERSREHYAQEDISGVFQTSANMLRSLSNQGGNKNGTSAISIRNSFCEHFNSASGAVYWQDKAIEDGNY